jgi:nitrile hydratase accessory protein
VSRGTRSEPDLPPGLAQRRAIERLVEELPTSWQIPRREGELSFREPWEVRTLGIVVQMHEAGHFAWSDFQSALVEVIGEWEAMAADERPPWSYYACWQQAAERLVVAGNQFVSPEEFDQRAEEFLSGKRTPPHTHGGGLLTRDTGTRRPPAATRSTTQTRGEP